MSDDKPGGKPKQKTLYEVLNVEKNATDDDIKRAYRKLALKYHPDKNLDGDPVKTEKFKEINHAHAILSNLQRRKIYDDIGEFGLKMADQFGEKNTTLLLRPWVKWLFCAVSVLTCGFFGCCCCCFCCCQCCCNCCGRWKPEFHEAEFDTNGETIVSQPTETENVTNVPQACSETAPAFPSNSIPLNTASSSPTNYGSTKI